MTATFYVGDAIKTMNALPEKSVDLILTSPPFLALRSYLPADHPDKAKEGGSQPTPGAFIDWLLDVVEACDRVLAPHGSLVFELGDTYSGTGGAGGDWSDSPMTTKARVAGGSNGGPTKRVISDGWPLAKSLSLIPESFRWAMVYGHNPHTGRQTEPWRLRNVIRWVRPNPPVGALGDKFRPATSELMVFCKAKDRFFDLDAVREPHSRANFGNLTPNKVTGSRNDDGKSYYTDSNPAGAPPLDWWNIPQNDDFFSLNPHFEPGWKPKGPPSEWWNIPLLEGEKPTPYGPEPERPKTRAEKGMVGKVDPRDTERAKVGLSSGKPGVENNPAGAPPLDWWNIPPGGYPGAHYAVWPPELLIKPIKAMCPERVCKTCGEPSRRIVEREYDRTAMPNGDARQVWAVGSGWHQGEWVASAPKPTSVTESWSDCSHDDWRPGLVLDPFGGSGTTAAVATGHGRDCWLIDLDGRNFDLALDRVGPLVLTRGEVTA